MNGFGAFVVLASCLVAISYAEPSDTRHIYHHQDTAKMAYDFGYQHADAYTGNHQGRKETRDAYGNVKGSYNLVEADGSVRVVEYTADPHNGFIAHVKDKHGVRTFGKPSYGHGPHHGAHHGHGYGHHGPAPYYHHGPAY